jgi:1,4-dihydroxy-2-naphthoyl-CoA hydrolase
MGPLQRPLTRESFQAIGTDHLPGLLGLEVVEVAPALCRIRVQAGPHLHAPNGYLHGGAVVALADTACGYGCVNSLPEDATGFTTIELKTNFLGTLRQGPVLAEARLAHGGRTTQVWDATVVDETSGKVLAIFRCTQLLLSR